VDKNSLMKPAITPGKILLEDYLVPMSISQNALARALGITPRSIIEIVLSRPAQPAAPPMLRPILQVRPRVPRQAERPCFVSVRLDFLLCQQFEIIKLVGILSSKMHMKTA
jgi:hypothetical protein